MDPKTRKMKKVSISDVENTTLMLNTLMGENVGARKDFIMNNAVEHSTLFDLDF